MRNTKGFTLIELLAVIIILAIIALIATPIVLTLLNDARKSAAVDSTYGIVKSAEYYYAQQLLTSPDGMAADAVFKVNGKKLSLRTSDDTGFVAPAVDLDFKGTAPSEGTITVSKDGKVSVSSLKVNNFTCTIDANDVASCS